MNLADIFTDVNGDALTYRVLINGGAYAAANRAYFHTPVASETYMLAFKANDGKADSADTYTAILTVAAASHFSGGSVGSSGNISITGTTSPVTGAPRPLPTFPLSAIDSTTTSVVSVSIGNVTVAAPLAVPQSALGGGSALQLTQTATTAIQNTVLEAATTEGLVPVFSFDLGLPRVGEDGTATAVHQPSGPITVTVALTDAQRAEITYDAAKGTLTFTTDHFSTYVVATGTMAASTVPGVSYAAHVRNIGWQKAVADGAEAGIEHRSLRMEAVQIKLTGSFPTGASIVYQAHVQNKGWLASVSDDAIAGTTGKGLRMEALEIRIVKIS